MQSNGTMLSAPSANTTQANSSNQVSSIDIGENLHNKISSDIQIKNIYQKPTDQVLNSAALRANIVSYSLQANFSRLGKQSDIKENTPNESYLNQQKAAFESAKQPDLIQKQNSTSSKSVTKFQKVSYPPMPTLGFGDSGISVRVLQRLLLANGYAIQVDGTFGALTETAVKTFQYRRNLLVDGIVGQQTWYELTK
ncbi:MAG: peptidoglycan-binding protein [Aetokthonos hydrillicola CCALA 1050]|nr:peptidoglycan-binding protein [Aetokthonos hydrillicola CCALA 1050]MBW4583843.1 peptidoglycan-binding protein [Aetokthonos hydrillicola CCALA 1050]